MRTLQPHAARTARAPDRLGQRAAARALHAAVLAGWAPTTRPAAPGLGAAAAPDRGVLGARRGVHARRAVAAHAAPDARTTASEGHAWMRLPAATRAGRLAARRGRATGAPSTAARPRRRAAARRRSTGAGTGRRPRRRWSTSSPPASSPSPAATPPSSGVYDLPERVLPPERLARPEPDRRGGAPSSCAPGGAVATASAPSTTCATTSGCGPSQAAPALADAGRGRGAAAGARSRAGTRPAYLHRDAALPRRVRRPGAAQPVRPAGVGARPHRAPLRLPLPDRDLRPGGEAGARLLRAAVPARGPDRRPGRPQGRPARPARCWCKASYAEPGAPAETAEELAAELRRAGRLAGAGRRSRSSRAATWPPAAAPAAVRGLPDRFGRRCRPAGYE